jgi:Ca2+-binding RTX toxin-like protein
MPPRFQGHHWQLRGESARGEECLMAHISVTGLQNGSINITTSGNAYEIAKHATVIATGDYPTGQEPSAIYEDPNAAPSISDNTYDIDGRIIGYEDGIQTFGVHDRINIGADGKVSGSNAINVTGDGSVITNHGQIISPKGTGLYDGGSHSRVENFGTIIGFTAFDDESTDGLTIVNGAKGRIHGIDEAVYMGFGASRFVNHGLIHGVNDAVNGGAGDDTMINDGIVDGAVELGDGKDVLDTRKGAIHGSIFGQGGDDLLITDNAKYKLMEDADSGADTVESTVSYKLSENVETLILTGKSNINGIGTTGVDTLIGNVGNNKLTGGDGFDTLVGGKGDDELIGDRKDVLGAADTFVFSTGDGHDKVMDYIGFSDVLDFTNWNGIDNFSDVVSHAHDSDEGLLIKLGQDSLLIFGFSKADLSHDGWTFKF